MPATAANKELEVVLSHSISNLSPVVLAIVSALTVIPFCAPAAEEMNATMKVKLHHSLAPFLALLLQSDEILDLLAYLKRRLQEP